MVRAIGVLVLVSAALFAGLTLWTNHTTAAAAARSRAFAQELPEPPNVHRAVARLASRAEAGTAVRTSAQRDGVPLDRAKMSPCGS